MQTPHSSGEMLRQELEVELDVIPADNCSCVPDESGSDADSAWQNAVDDRHHTDMIVPSSEDCCPDEEGGCVLHRTDDIGDECPFHAFYHNGWVPRIDEIAENRIRIRTYLPDRDALAEIIETLEETVEAFQVQRLAQIDIDDDGAERDRTTFDLTGLTEKQRDAAIEAVQAGYYETQRQTSFDDLARRIGISKSALSRRLNAVEAELMRTAFG